MLYNTNPWSPGKFEVRKNIQNIWNACNTELFVRVILHEYDTPIKTKKDILEFINGMRSQFDHNIIGDSISVLFNGLEPEFEKITVNKLMDACFDKLDVLNTKLITEKFILAQGIWLTDEEKKDLTEYDAEGKVRNRMEVIKERLAGWINPNARLRISQTGLTYNEFRSLVQLGQMPKISSLSTAIKAGSKNTKFSLIISNTSSSFSINSMSSSVCSVLVVKIHAIALNLLNAFKPLLIYFYLPTRYKYIY